MHQIDRYPHLLCCAVLLGCQPTLDTPLSRITGTRILAIQAEPAEAMPGGTVRYRALVASPGGTVSAALDWSFCTLPKPPGENNIVDPACLTAPLDPAGLDGPDLTAATPADGCARFGPALPPPARPRDPDATGGYYQPLRSQGEGQTAIFLLRITCELAHASAQVAAEYRARYSANRNPQLLAASLRASRVPDNQVLSLDTLPAGEPIRLSIDWSAGSAESYPVFDPARQTLLDHRETLRVSWFATAGTFATEHTGTGEGERATGSDDVWTAPAAQGPVHLWIVLRDARGGSDFVSRTVRVAH